MSADEKNKKLSTESIKAEMDEKPPLDSVDADAQNKKPERVKPDSKMCLIERGVSGKVMWYSPYKGFGFLSRDDGQPDVFVHSSAIVRINRYVRVLTAEEEVEFDVVRGHKGPEATAVTGKNGKVIHAYAYRVGQSVRVSGVHYRGRRNEANGVSGKTEDKEKAEDSTSTDESEGGSTETTSSSSSEEVQQKKGNRDVKQQPSEKPQNGKETKLQAPAKTKEKQSPPQKSQEPKVGTQKVALEPKGKQPPPQKQQDPKTEKPKVVQKQPEQKSSAGKAAK